MSKQPAPISFTQLEDALEERQKPDRRQEKQALPANVEKDRRQADRRTKPVTS